MAETPRATIDDPCPDPETDGQHCFRCPDACCHCGARKHQAAAPSVGEPEPLLSDDDLRTCAGDAYASHSPELRSLCLEVLASRAELSALRSSLEEARKDSERLDFALSDGSLYTWRRKTSGKGEVFFEGDVIKDRPELDRRIAEFRADPTAHLTPRAPSPRDEP